jgi:hypothetical protein
MSFYRSLSCRVRGGPGRRTGSQRSKHSSAKGDVRGGSADIGKGAAKGTGDAGQGHWKGGLIECHAHAAIQLDDSITLDALREVFVGRADDDLSDTRIARTRSSARRQSRQRREFLRAEMELRHKLRLHALTGLVAGPEIAPARIISGTEASTPDCAHFAALRVARGGHGVVNGGRARMCRR